MRGPVYLGLSVCVCVCVFVCVCLCVCDSRGEDCRDDLLIATRAQTFQPYLLKENKNLLNKGLRLLVLALL